MFRLLVGLALAAGLIVSEAAPASAATPTFGQLFYNGVVVRTLVPPAATPKAGRDPFYVIDNGVPGQLSVAAVAPGAPGYHGGQWQVFHVQFTVAPYLLTSAAAVQAAAAAGDLTITRTPAEDFKCPIQP
jgi:hypothetical protein